MAILAMHGQDARGTVIWPMEDGTASGRLLPTQVSRSGSTTHEVSKKPDLWADISRMVFGKHFELMQRIRIYDTV